MCKEGGGGVLCTSYQQRLDQTLLPAVCIKVLNFKIGNSILILNMPLSPTPSTVALPPPPRCLSLWDTPLVKNHGCSSRREGRRLMRTNSRILKVAGMILSGGKSLARLSRKPL